MKAQCVAVLVVVFLAGCVPSLHRLYDEQTLVFEPGLLGRWTQGEDIWTNVLTFERGEDKSFRLTIVDKDDKLGQFVVHLVRLNGRLFMDVFPGEMADETVHDLYKRHLIPGHLFWKVDSLEPRLRLRAVNPDAVSRMVKENPTCTQLEILDETGQWVLTADTRRLQEFVVRLADANDGFGPAEEFTRLAPLCSAKAVEFDKALVGEWSDSEWTLTSTANNGSYDLTQSDAFGRKNYRATLTRLEQFRFWAVFRGAVEPVDGDNVRMPDMLVWIEQTQPVLRLRATTAEEMLQIASLKGRTLRQRLEQLPAIDLRGRGSAGGTGQIRHGALEATYSVEPMPQYDALFTRDTGWTGADGAYSVAMSDTVTLWLYMDTWIGRIINQRHEDAAMVSNTIALQTGKNPSSASVSFFWQMTEDGRPTAFIKPAEGVGEFWIFHSVVTDGQLYLFLKQIIEGGRYIATWLGKVENPQDEPPHWRVKQYRVPFGRYSMKGDLSFGSAVMRDGDLVYVYGYAEQADTRQMTVSRATADHMADFNEWRFWTGTDWVADANQSAGLFQGLACEYSVSFQPALKKYVVVYTDGGMSADIVMRVSDTPVGPWSEPCVLYTCPEPRWHKTYFCYAGKGHPEISGPDELIVTYVCNSSDFARMAGDARIYRPRFLKMRFSTP